MGNHDFEGQYERKLAREKSSKKVRVLLPIKTRGGFEEQTLEVEEDEVGVPDQEEEQEEVDEDGLTSFGSSLIEEQEEAASNKIISQAMLMANRRHKLEDYKMKIGILSASFLEDPDNRLKNLDSLLAMLDIKDPAVALTVPKYAAVSLCAVFIDVLPSYAIKHHNQPGIKLKNETKQRQGQETQVLKRYKVYLQRIEKLVSRYLPRKRSAGGNVSVQSESKLGKTALTCMCKMLISHPYFNMSTNIANFIVPFLNNWDEDVRKIVLNSIQSLFKSDKRGEMSYEVVRRINLLIKTCLGKQKSGRVRREVLDVLLALRIKEADLEKEKLQEMQPNGKITFEQRRMLSKKGRKKSKELVQLEKELLEASAEENKSQKSHYLTEITKLVFTMYFRALKSNPMQQTLTAVLEGLAKFAHVINIDYFEDLLHVLQDLLKKENIHEHERLLCIATVLSVLDGHGSALTLDPVSFHKQLYTSINNLKCGKSESDAGLALRCVRLATSKRQMPGLRAIAFAKRISTVATQLEWHDAAAALMELKQILRLHSASSGLLDTDGASANGVYSPELDDPDHCCAQASTLWELTTLSYHYHPWVRQIAHSIAAPDKIDPLPKEIGQKKPEDIAIDLNPYETMEFTPLYTPKQTSIKFKKTRFMPYQPKTDYFREDKYFDEFSCEDDQHLNKLNFAK